MAVELKTTPQDLIEEYRHGFHDSEDKYVFKSAKGLTREIVERISAMKDEPEWMLDFRLKALRDVPQQADADVGRHRGPQRHRLRQHPLLRARLVRATEQSWDDVPDDIKKTFDRLGIPEAERKFLSGVSAPSTNRKSSTTASSRNSKKTASSSATWIPRSSSIPRSSRSISRPSFRSRDNKFAALNSAVWSGGSFVYVPPGVEVKMPLQAYFRINTENMGQFERTLIIADKGSKVHYIEGCTAPKFSTSSLHSAVVELIAMEGASIRYTTIQNWYRNIYQPGHQARRRVQERDRRMGRRQHRLAPDDEVSGDLPDGRRRARRDPLGGVRRRRPASGCRREGDPRARPNTTSVVTNKSVSAHGGKTTYRGLVEIHPGAVGAKTRVRCDALIMDDRSSSDTKPTMKIDEQHSTVEHEASVSKIGEEQLFYAMSRGLSEADATAMIVNGFFDFFVKELPMEYAVELNRLIKMEMEGVGRLVRPLRIALFACAAASPYRQRCSRDPPVARPLPPAHGGQPAASVAPESARTTRPAAAPGSTFEAETRPDRLPESRTATTTTSRTCT